MVLELLEGETLGARLAREGRLPIEVALGITDQIASALSAAHGRDIIHRDLKPENVFLCTTDAPVPHVKVLDFGIGKMRGAEGSVTGQNSLLGTPDYMAPEQAEGRSRDVDARCDQFALGSMLHEMMTGERPFAGDGVLGTLYQVVNHDPPNLDEAVGAPPALAEAVRRAMSKTPEQRFANIRAFARAARGETDDAAGSHAGSSGHAPTMRAASTGNGVRDTGPDAYGTTFSGSAAESIAVDLTRARWPWAIGAALLVAAVAAVWVWRSRGAEPTDAAALPAQVPAQIAATPVVEPPDAAAPPTITLRFDIQPDPDRIRVDGIEVSGSETTLAKDDRPHVLVIEKKGYRDERLDLEATVSQTVRLRLTRASRRAPVRPRKPVDDDEPKKPPSDDFILDF
jgi:serine/threonine-protein kinase